MNAKHTPGPWKACNRIGNRTLQSWRVASDSTDQPCSVCRMDESLTGDQEVANAHLIAAAPDLLAAAQLAMQRLEMYGLAPQCNDAIKAVNAAIARATGNA